MFIIGPISEQTPSLFYLVHLKGALCVLLAELTHPKQKYCLTIKIIYESQNRY